VRSRAYVRFKTADDLVVFHRVFNGHIFTDSKGTPRATPANLGRSSRAIVEYSPYQKSLRGKPKQDPRQGTIESSPEYKEFLESLAKPVTELSPPETTEEPTTTPLIEFIRAQKIARQEKEKATREKARQAKVATAQAKANALSAKMRLEKGVVKGEGKVEGGKVEGGKVATRGGRGGPRVRGPKAHQVKVVEKKMNVDTSEGVATISVSGPPEGLPFRGRGGRGRGRAQGVYRGRGRGRERGMSLSEGQPMPSTADG
jgi:regulator of nonsense transcripts 3